MRNALDTIVAQTVATAEQEENAAQDAYTTGRTLVVALILAGLILGVIAAVGIARLITRPLSRCVATLERSAAGT